MSDRDEALLPAGIYCRISRDLGGESLGVTRQLEDCTDLAAKLGWSVTEATTYIDNDASATSGKPRPAYRRMLDDIKAGRIKGIIAWHPDRLYRRAVDLGELVDVVNGNQARVATVNAGEVDLASPTGLLVADMLAAIAMYEVRHKSERWTRGWRQQRELGIAVRTGSRMFGYTHELEIVPEEATIARKMAADLLAGVPINTIARNLNKQGVTATRGNDWRPAGVRTYLSNPKLAGYSTMKGEIVSEGQWKPILDRETWEAVRAILDSRSRPSAAPRVALLGGLIFCGSCGFRMITSRSKAGRSYRCPNRPGLEGCGRISGAAQPIEEVAESFTRTRLDRPEVQQRVAGLRESTGTLALLSEATALEARVVELEAELDTPGVPVASILRAIDRAKTRLGEVRTEVAASSDLRMAKVPAGGAPWPTALADRRRLVMVALGDLRVYLDPRIPGWPNTKGFDLRRIRLARELDERPGVALG